MNNKLNLIFVVAMLLSLTAFSQSNEIKWWNPAQNSFDVIDNQGWQEGLKSPYHRLPAKAKETVRTPVWNLSNNSAGIKIRFRTNASEIKVRYGLNGGFAMPHMPSTGVSGVDLYAKNADGKWIWCRGNFSFADTCSYHFKGITPNDGYHKMGREYHLYLPLYNSVEWMEIGIAEDSLFEPLPLRQQKPIVVYGTSIAQGACASRPGMAWTSILERRMDAPVVNLAFSGNGRLEPEMAELLGEIDARAYVLDCLPNLPPEAGYTAEEVYNLIVKTVKKLRSKSTAPVLLVQHAGYGHQTSNRDLRANTNELNITEAKAYADLKTEGLKNIYLLTQKELALCYESFVDGIHPSDLGMKEYAQAYEKKLREILNETVGAISTTIPVTQSREPGMYNWEARHNTLLVMNRSNPPKICFFGNSITHYWGGKPEAKLKNGSDSWEKYLGDLSVQNFGFGWDRVENVLWRIYHGELDEFTAEQVVFMLGTNNLHSNSDEEIIEGLKLVINATKTRQPKARILLLGIYPRRDKEERVANINLKIAQLAGNLDVDYTDVGRVLLNTDGKINETLFTDGLHPNSKGYNKLAPEIRKELTK